MTFLALHGGSGEDGRLQAALDMHGILYTGSDYLSSGIAMDKDMTKQLVAAQGVITPAWETVEYTQADIPALLERTKLPCVVKPMTAAPPSASPSPTPRRTPGRSGGGSQVWRQVRH